MPVVLITCLAVPLTVMGADAHSSTPSGDASIVSPDAKLELLFSDAFFTEGAAVAPDGSVYFSDITFYAWVRYAGGTHLEI